MNFPLTDLISRLERASGPDRELDVLVHLSLTRDAYTREDVDDLLRLKEEPTGYGVYRDADRRVSQITGSLDAALALVEAVRPGLTIHLNGMPHLAEAERRWMAQLETEAWKCVAEEYASTAPLALIKALLRSLEAAA